MEYYEHRGLRQTGHDDTLGADEEISCEGCDRREKCKNICKRIQKAIQQGRGTPERHYHDHIVIFPTWHAERNFASLSENGRQPEQFSEDEVLKLQTDVLETKTATIFAEVFFNNAAIGDIADRLGIQYGTAHSYYERACKKLEMLVGILDRRDAALKHVKHGNMDKLSDDEKAFLLSHVFGFKVSEVAEIVGGPSASMWKKRIKRLADKYKAAFDTVNRANETDSEDGETRKIAAC